VRETSLDALECAAPFFVVRYHRRVRFLIESVEEAALRGARAEPIVELRRPRHRRVDVFDAVHHAQAGSELLTDAVLIGERERTEGPRRILSCDEVLDVIRDFEGALLDVVPAHGRMGNALRAQQLREVQEPAHSAGVRTAMDLEEELLSDRRGEQVGVMRSSA